MSSNLPHGVYGRQRHSEVMICPVCGNRWWLATETALGQAEVVEGSYQCPSCGAFEGPVGWMVRIACPHCGKDGDFRYDAEDKMLVGTCQKCRRFVEIGYP